MHDRGVLNDKRALRASLRRARAGRANPDPGAPALLAAASAAGLLDPAGRPDVVGAVALAAYLAAPGEPDPALIAAAVSAAGGLVALPIPHRDRTLGWAVDDGRHVPVPWLAVRMPGGPQVGVGAAGLGLLGVGLILVPALAVDRAGGRLGQGGGYYDRLIAELASRPGRRPALIAVVHPDEVLPAGAIPRQGHDATVDAALTVGGLIRLGPAPTSR